MSMRRALHSRCRAPAAILDANLDGLWLRSLQGERLGSRFHIERKTVKRQQEKQAAISLPVDNARAEVQKAEIHRKLEAAQFAKERAELMAASDKLKAELEVNTLRAENKELYRRIELMKIGKIDFEKGKEPA